MRIAHHLLALVLLAGGPAAMAQPTDTPHQPVPVKGEGPQGVVIPPAPTPPPFTSLAKKGPDGKVVRLEGCVDVLAFEANTLITPSVKEAIKPAVLNWMADVDQLAIDNLDFLEKLDPAKGKPGALDKLDINDKALLTQLSLMMNQLMSAGPLTAHLEVKGALTREQSGQNQMITSDYLQQVMNEIQADQGPPELAGQPEKAKEWRINELTRFLYALSCKDSVVAYRRLMSDAAPNIEAILASLKLDAEQASKANAEVAGVKAAKSPAERRAAVRKVMDQLTFEQRRQFLTKARELAPVTDPYVVEQS